jgi:hypothetical protein
MSQRFTCTKIGALLTAALLAGACAVGEDEPTVGQLEANEYSLVEINTAIQTSGTSAQCYHPNEALAASECRFWLGEGAILAWWEEADCFCYAPNFDGSCHIAQQNYTVTCATLDP